MGRGFQQSSGRVIGLGRLLLATLYLLAILFDASQPARAVVATWALLAAYLAFAVVTVATTWRDWWLDAKVAGAAHAIDILFFTLLVGLTEGYTSPFFTFFIFVLLSAAIRWGWRATALTAVLLVLLHLVAGMVAATSSPQVEIQRFAMRTGHLAILSLILIWFGAGRWNDRFRSLTTLLGGPAPGRLPLESALRALIDRYRAASGVFVWRAPGAAEFAGVAIRDGASAEIALPERKFRRMGEATAFLYDVDENRCLRKDSEHNLLQSSLDQFLDQKVAAGLGLIEGLAIPVESGDGNGAVFLNLPTGLSTDHIDLGEQLAPDIAAYVQGHALLKAADENAEARSRLTLARDLHDGVVQFLAGAAFRLEAMRRAHGKGRDVGPDLDELKDLILQEQHELRTFITALRSGPFLAFNDLANDLGALAGRLARQWDVECTFSSNPSQASLPARLHLDAQQLIREAVANAVRHAAPKSIRIAVAADGDALRLEVVNDGAAPRRAGGKIQTPMSLKDRVDAAGGTIDIARGMGVTKVSIALPIAARPQ